MNSTNKSYNLLLLATALLFTTNMLSAANEHYEPATPQEKPSWFSSSWLGKKWAERKKRKRAEHLATRDEKVQATREKLITRTNKANAKKLIVAKEVYADIQMYLVGFEETIKNKLLKANLHTIEQLNVAFFQQRISGQLLHLKDELNAQLGTITWYLDPTEAQQKKLPKILTQENENFLLQEYPGTPTRSDQQHFTMRELNSTLTEEQARLAHETKPASELHHTTLHYPKYPYRAPFSGRSTPASSEYDRFSSSPTSSTTSSLRQPEQQVSIFQTKTPARPTIRGVATALNVRQRFEADKLAREREQERKAATSQIIHVDTRDISGRSRSNSANRLNTPPMDPFNISSRGVMPLSLQQSPTDQVRWVQPTS